MVTHSSILAWRIPWTYEPGRLHTVHGVAKSWTELKQLSMQTGEVKETNSGDPRCVDLEEDTWPPVLL